MASICVSVSGYICIVAALKGLSGCLSLSLNSIETGIGFSLASTEFDVEIFQAVIKKLKVRLNNQINYFKLSFFSASAEPMLELISVSSSSEEPFNKSASPMHFRFWMLIQLVGLSNGRWQYHASSFFFRSSRYFCVYFKLHWLQK